MLTDLTVAPMLMKNRLIDVPFVSILANETWHVVACYVQDMMIKNRKIILSRGEIIENLKSANNGSSLAASSRNNILVGSLSTSTIPSIKELAYEFYVLDCPDEITCIDLRVGERIHLSRKSQRQTGDEPVMEVVVGCARGSIYYYNDLLPQLRYLQKAGRGASLQPRKYHWHRKAVHAVKWSQDGMLIAHQSSRQLANRIRRKLHHLRWLRVCPDSVAVGHPKDRRSATFDGYHREYRHFCKGFELCHPSG